MGPDVAGPPWKTRQAWQAANSSIRFLFDHHPASMQPLVAIAGRIRKRLNALDAIYTDLCGRTCPHCPDPCCMSADVWFDFADLIFFHAADVTVATRNPKKSKDETCWFLGKDGCMLSRANRPWICNWYLCTVQKHRLQRRHPKLLSRLQALTEVIRIDRKRLEKCFIDIVRPDTSVSPGPEIQQAGANFRDR